MSSKIFKRPILFIGITLFLIFISIKIYKNFSKVSSLPIPTQQDFLESYFRNKNDYEESFFKFENVEKKHVLAAITSHHFLAKDLIAQTFAGIDPKNVKKEVIVGPDHFHQLTGTKYLAQTTDTSWQTPFGSISADTQIINILSQNNEVLSDINAFRAEHSVYLLVPFAKKSFSEAEITPLILRQKNDFPYYYGLGKKVAGIIKPEETILVISSDFSHNATREQARLDDRRSIGLLKEMEIDKVSLVENDCKQCVAFLYGYLEGKNVDFELVFNINSFDISGESPKSVTSYVSTYFIEK